MVILGIRLIKATPMEYEREIFVFGANLAGRHGKGSALEARNYYGAKYGNPVGLQGNSYAIPTKDENIQTLPIERIIPYINDFIEFAKSRPKWKFNVVRIGCMLAGYKDSQIAPLFKGSPPNCYFQKEWDAFLKETI